MSLTPQIKRYVARQLQGAATEGGSVVSGWVSDGLDIAYTQGSVGIGASPSSYALTVGGDVDISGGYRINGTSVLSATALGSGVVSSSLTSVGTLTSLSVSGAATFSTISVGNSSTPSSGVADTVQVYAADRSAGNTIPAVYCEGTGVTDAGITNTTVTHKIALSVNGTVYYLLATTNAT